MSARFRATASASAGEPDFTGPATTATPEELSLEGNEQNAANGESGNADGGNGSAGGSTFTPGSGDWLDKNSGSGSGSGNSGGGSGSSGNYDVPTFTEKDS